MPVVGPLLNVLDTYPRISAWVVLSVGIIALLVYEARDVGLSAGNWVALIIASIVVAGLCIWIVSEEDEEERAEATGRGASAQASAIAPETDTTTTEDMPASEAPPSETDKLA